MTDISITAASVVKGSAAQTERGTLGETVTAGQVLYKSSTTNKWMKADNNSVIAEAKVPKGIALNGGAINQPVEVHLAGPLTIGATLTAGTAYYLSDTPGGICPVADVGAGEDVALLGVASSTTVLDVRIQVPGVTL